MQALVLKALPSVAVAVGRKKESPNRSPWACWDPRRARVLVVLGACRIAATICMASPVNSSRLAKQIRVQS